MPSSIQIKESKGPGTPWRFTQEFQTKAEFDRVNGLCIDRWRGNIFTQSFFVMRTDTFDHFVQDFFFPNVIGALKTKDLALRIFSTLICFFYDIIFFPLRCLTLIPRYLWNRVHSRDNHPLHQYLVRQGADPVLLNRDSVYMSKKTFTLTSDHKFDFERTEETLDFIGLPDHAERKYSASSNCLVMLGRHMDELEILQQT